MKTFQSPLKNPAATSLSLLLGVIIIVSIALSFRIADNDRLIQKSEPIIETAPVSPEIIATQDIIRNNREKKLLQRASVEQKTITTTKPVQTTTIVTPKPVAPTPAPAKKKSNRTTKTS